MNFRVIENAPPSYLEKYEDFIELYSCSEICVHDIMKRLNLSQKEYKAVREKALKEGRIVLRRRAKPKNPRYYYYSSEFKRWVVSKNIKKTKIQIHCKTEEQAQKAVELLKKSNWDKSKIPEIKKIVGL